MLTDKDRQGILDRKLNSEDYRVTYCAYCKDRTAHEIIKGHGIRTLNCVRCGSDRLDTIQGFDASLM